MLQVRRRLDLGQESCAADDRRQLGLQDLDRNFPIVTHIVREVHGRHPA